MSAEQEQMQYQQPEGQMPEGGMQQYADMSN